MTKLVQDFLRVDFHQVDVLDEEAIGLGCLECKDPAQILAVQIPRVRLEKRVCMTDAELDAWLFVTR